MPHAAMGCLNALSALPSLRRHLCSGPSCQTAHWEYSPWSACNATCGGGVATRVATCSAPSGSKCDPATQQATEQECNTAACEVFAWRAGDWGACSASCGGAPTSRPLPPRPEFDQCAGPPL